LLRDYDADANVELAYALKDICLADWSNEPARARGAAAALTILAEITKDREVAALAAWVIGLASLADGQIEQAIRHLEDSESRFLELNQPHMAASTQVAKLYVLALLGRYDEAIACGLRAREVLLAHGDIANAGKIEHNIGNIYLRRDQYEKARDFQYAARGRFIALNDQRQLAKINNNLAIICASQHKFRDAERLYAQALASAEEANLLVTQAEIESNIGNLALFQGRFDRALNYLERARRKYAALGMPHQSAIAEQEIADAYLELNLAPEAAEVYERVIPVFAKLGMRAEQARALAFRGRALILLHQTNDAREQLAEARKLYAAEENSVGEAMVQLTKAQLDYDESNYEAASDAAMQAEAPLVAAGSWRRVLLARWLQGESARALGLEDKARKILETTLRDAELYAQPQAAQRSFTSLGLLATTSGDARSAEASFKRAIAIIEDLRAPLPAEEFRTAFFADKLVPYDEMVRLCLTDKSKDRTIDALGYVERARSRALVDMLGGALKFDSQPHDSFEAHQLARLDELRAELNWFYNQLNRPLAGDAARTVIETAALHEAIRERESKTLELMRQLQHLGGQTTFHVGANVEVLDVTELQRDLGTDSALIEYTSLDDELLAFIVTNEGVECVRGLGNEAEVTTLIEQFHFQISSLRYGAERMRKHLPSLTARANTHLQRLYNLLLRPVEQRIGARRLVIVPHRTLHYVPFHALYDGAAYVIERREVCYAPSAIVLRHCLAKPLRFLERALLVGVSDAETPRVRDEIEALAPLFSEAVSLIDAQATLAATQAQAEHANVLHFACHGQFRPDNPLFSSLQLADDWLTVREAYQLKLKDCGLVTLSACETGVNAIAPGDELIGLARGFFSAGAPSLVLSLWMVDDEATAALMAIFYQQLRKGEAPAAALRAAQLQILETRQHPFFWSPFVLMGRW